MLDFERIRLLLEVFHNSIDVPGLKPIQDAALAELQSMPKMPPAEEPKQPEEDPEHDS